MTIAAPTARPAPPPAPRARANGTEPPRSPRVAVAFGPIPDGTGHRIVLFGPGGIGKTTLAATAPGPVAFFDLDDSLPRLKAQLADAPAKPDLRAVSGIRTWQNMRDALHADGWEQIKTIVIDSATRAEELAVEHTLATVPHEKGQRVQRIEDYGFGKGYSHVYDTFLTLLGDLDQHIRVLSNVRRWPCSASATTVCRFERRSRTACCPRGKPARPRPRTVWRWAYGFWGAGCAPTTICRSPRRGSKSSPRSQRRSPCHRRWPWCSGRPTKFHKQRAVHFAFEDRVPKDVWDKNWTLWYDHALVTRRQLPADVLLSGTFAIEEVSTGMGADNMELVRPWAGIVARMQDLRRYYFLTLEYPGKVALYRRDDHQWQEIAWAQVNFGVFAAHRLTLQCRGSNFKAWIDDQFLFEATDYGYASGGYCGARATCVAFVTDFSARRSPSVSTMTHAPAAPALEELPAPRVVRDFDLAALGPLSKTPRHHASLTLGHFTTGAGEPQLLVQCFAHPAGVTHALVDLHGKTLWTGTWPGANLIHVLPPGRDGRCDLIALGRDMYRIDGRTGDVSAHAPLPESPEGRVSTGNGPQTMADLDGDGVLDTFFLTCGANNPHIWAYDHDLRQRWYLQTPSGHGHGWHLAVCDADGDGRDEVFSGCARISPDGRIVWAQEEVVRRLKCLNGYHVDSAQAGLFDGPEAPPTLHYQASSAGHLVVDARSGALLAAHPQGHAQCGSAGRVIPGSMGVQVISSNRWGSYGVTAIYDGVGNRLSRFQPGFTCQLAEPINWTGGEHEHLLVCDGQGYRGIYDHLGRRLIDLEPLMPYTRGAFEQRFDRVNTLNTPIVSGSFDDLLVRIDTRIRVLSAARAPLPGRRPYAPQRRGNASWPAVR